MAGPINGIRFVHKAIRKELESLEEASRVGPRSGGQVETLTERFSFLQTMVRSHAEGEEAVFYPALDNRAGPVSKPYVLDHQAEESLFRNVWGLITQLRTARTEEQRAELARRLHRQVVALNVTLSLHIWKEEEHLVPLTEKHFSAPEQGALVGRIIGHIPQELMQQALPWILVALTPEEREEYLQEIRQAVPPGQFRVAAGWIKAGIPAGDWADLVGRIPELGSAPD